MHGCTIGARWLADEIHDLGAANEAGVSSAVTTAPAPPHSDRWPIGDCMSDRAYMEWIRLRFEAAMERQREAASCPTEG